MKKYLKNRSTLIIEETKEGVLSKTEVKVKIKSFKHFFAKYNLTLKVKKVTNSKELTKILKGFIVNDGDYEVL